MLLAVRGLPCGSAVAADASTLAAFAIAASAISASASVEGFGQKSFTVCL